MFLTTKKQQIGHTQQSRKPLVSRQITVCPQCGDVRYKRVWYAPDSRFALLINENKDTVIYQACPACQMQEKNLFEGVLYVRDIPTHLRDRVWSIIQHEAEQACIENPQHRVLEYSDVVDGYKVTATNAAMTRRIGRKLQRAFGTCEVQSMYHRDPYPLLITSVVFVTSEYF